MSWNQIGTFDNPRHVQPLAIAFDVFDRFLTTIRRRNDDVIDGDFMVLISHEVNGFLKPLVHARIVLEANFNFSLETMPPDLMDAKKLTATLHLQPTRAHEYYRYKFEHDLNTKVSTIWAMS